MRPYLIIALLLCSMLWPASADLSDFQPIVKYTLPADIMQVAFADETWIYQLHEDGAVRKVVNKRIDSTHKEEEPAKRTPSA